MSEKLNEALAELIRKSTETAGDGLAFLQGEAPEIVQQLLLWNLVQWGFWFAFSILLLAALVVVDLTAIRRGAFSMCVTENLVARAGETPWHTYARFKNSKDVHDQSKAQKVWVDYIFAYWGIVSVGRLFVYGVAVGIPFNLIWLEILIAPKAWLLKYAADLLS